MNKFYWWLIRVIFVVAFGFFASKFWEGTYEWYLGDIWVQALASVLVPEPPRGISISLFSYLRAAAIYS